MSITDEDDTLQTRLDELATAVKKVEAAADMAAMRREEKAARSLLNAVKGEAQKFRNSVQKLDDPMQRSVFNRKYNAYDEKLKAADKELRNLITAPKKPGAGGKGKKPTMEEKQMDDIMSVGGRDGTQFESAQQVMSAANRGQDDINKSLLRSLKLGHTMRDQTHEMLEALSKQTEKLYKVDQELAKLDGELDRAKMEVQWFFRQIAGDKCCIGLMVFLLLGVCGLIFWKIYSKRFPNAPFAIHTTTTTTTTLAPGHTAAPCFFICP